MPEMFNSSSVLDGVGRFIVEGTAYDIKPGTLMVIRPFEYHSIELDSDHQYERYVLNFSPSCLVDDALKLLQGFMSAEEGSGKLYSAGELSQNILPLFERFEIAETRPAQVHTTYTTPLSVPLPLV